MAVTEKFSLQFLQRYCAVTQSLARKARGCRPALGGLRRSRCPLDNGVNHHMLKVLARLCWSIGNALALTPVHPRELQPPTLIELVFCSSKAHTGWLLNEGCFWSSLLYLTRGEDTTPSALLTRMDTLAASRLHFSTLLIEAPVVTVNPAGTWLRRVQLHGIHARINIPADSIR
jgi:hypothetical protein